MKRKINSIIALVMTALFLATEIGGLPVVWAAELEEISEESGNDEISKMNKGRAGEDFAGEAEKPESAEIEDLGDVEYKYYKPYNDATYSLKYYVTDDSAICIAGIDGTDRGALVIPDTIDGKSVTTIGESAFQHCDGFTGSLTIPNSVTTIGKKAFYLCDGFTGSLTIPNGVTTIGEETFYHCDFTGSLTIPNSVTTIGDYAFNWCDGFTGSLTIPNSVTTIGEGAFAWCRGISGSLTIPNSVTTISPYAFANCSGFTGSLTIPDSVTTIGEYAFDHSGFTGSLTIPNGVTIIGDNAFLWCEGFTGNLTIPNAVTTIGDNAFCGCSGFTGSLTIPDSVTTIGQLAFYDCEGFTGSLIIPEGVTSLGDEIIAGTGISSVTIPSTVTSSGYDKLYETGALAGCTTLKEIVFAEGIKKIPDYICSCGYYIEKVVIPPSVVEIGYKAFNMCNKITIYCTAGSYAEQYAKDNKIPYVTDGNNEPIVESIILSKTKLSLKKDEENELSVTITPVEAAGAVLTWNSSDEGVVTISGSGTKVKVKAVGEGTAKVTVSAENGIKAMCDITVTAEGAVSENSPMNPVVAVCEDTTEIHLVKGQKFTLAESGWVSSDKTMLSISKKNLMTAKKVTSSPVKLTNNERSIDVYISQPKMAAKSITVQVGSTQSIGFNYDSDNLDVQWYCNTPDIATVSDEGEVTGVGKGTATITAFVNGSAYNCKVKVKEDVVAEERTLHMTLNAKKTISIKGLKKVTWVSDDETIVSVAKKNKLTALATGETVLRTEYEGKEYRIRVYVEDPTITTKEILNSGKNKYKLTLAPGASSLIEFTSVNQTVIFKSSKGEVAYADADGTIIANKPGKAKLTAKVNGKTITITVTVQ